MKISKKTWIDRCVKKSEEKGLVFRGFSEDGLRISGKSKCILYCPKHDHEWDTTNITNHIYRDNSSCSFCAIERRSDAFTKPEEPYKVVVKSVCAQYNSSFLGWSEAYKGSNTKIKQRCLVHPEQVWEDTVARSLVSGKNITSGCPSCHKEQYELSIKENEAKHVEQFMATGSFPEGYTFKKSPRKTKAGVRNYWCCTCPICSYDQYVQNGECSGVFESFTGTLKSGSLPCRCSYGTLGYYENRKDSKDFLYVLEFHNDDERFLKIGRSFYPEYRIKALSKNYQISVLKFLEDSHENVYTLEQKLHKLFRNFRYKPLIPFGGSVLECFEYQILEDVLKEIL